MHQTSSRKDEIEAILWQYFLNKMSGLQQICKKTLGKYLSMTIEKRKQIIIWQFTFQICSIDRTSTIRHLLECNLISDKNITHHSIASCKSAPFGSEAFKARPPAIGNLSKWQF